MELLVKRSTIKVKLTNERDNEGKFFNKVILIIDEACLAPKVQKGADRFKLRFFGELGHTMPWYGPNFQRNQSLK